MRELEDPIAPPVRFDPVAHAWAAEHPGVPFPRELERDADVCTGILGSLWKRVHSARLIESVLERLGAGDPARGRRASAPVVDGDAELGPGKFLGKPCPHGHRVRYEKTKACVMCLRAAVKRCNDRERRRAA